MMFLVSLSSSAQVTIGSEKEVNQGSLLDLKESESIGVNSNKGLLLPRVRLVDSKQLKPMYSYEDEANTPTSSELNDHTGLVVYNINKCSPFGMGLYVWAGNEWLVINKNKSLSPPSLTINADTLHIPSGMDKRVSVAQVLNFEWDGTSPTFTQPQSASTGSMSGGLVFTSPRGVSPSSGNWQTSPADLSVWADDMTDAIVTATDPWVTRQSKLAINLPENSCGPATVKNLILNQTNYAIIVGSTSNPTTDINLRDAEQGSLMVYSNTPWMVSAKANGSTWTIDDVLSRYTAQVKDEVTADGTTGTDYSFDYTGAGASSKRYSTVTLTFCKKQS